MRVKLFYMPKLRRRFYSLLFIILSIIILCVFLFNRGQLQRGNDSDDTYISWSFINLLRVVLARMVGYGSLHPALGGLHFWKNFPNKYHTVRSYEKSKVDNYSSSFIVIIIYMVVDIYCPIPGPSVIDFYCFL